MKIDLTTMVLSRPNTWLEIVGRREPGGELGIYLSTLQSDARPREIFRVLPLGERGDVLAAEPEATAAVATLRAAEGTVELLFDREGRTRIRSEGVGFRLFRPEPREAGYQADYPFEIGGGRIQVNAYRSAKQYMITVLEGKYAIDAPWDGVTCRTIALDFAPSADGSAEIAMEAFDSSWEMSSTYEDRFTACKAEAESAFERWLQATPAPDGGYPETRARSAYALYAPIVPPHGLLGRKTLLISSGFNGVWSWDHAFNAMGLAGWQPDMAWDQLLAPFDHQDEYGAIPDVVKNREIVWNFVKPPVHGWALRHMLRKTDRLDRLAELYPKLSSWTNWWFRYRDYGGSGFPQYNHGNDSGWDNATVFAVPGALEAPDLSAFLIIQMDALAEAADRLGRADEAANWRNRSEEHLSRMLERFWDGDMFVFRRVGTGEIVRTASLLHWMPVILGAKLPQPIVKRMAHMLGPKGPFLTDWGLATEQPASEYYETDGYWRGPIWAPVTYIAASGLADAGEGELAREIGRRFLRLCAHSGLAENYDPITGEAYRDKFHTWPASVFQLFAADEATATAGRG
ncbi:amylo-alpha-1,6-glucosidase [Cohnella zeiphila]|uniref:Mannosylglycerate hydrolase MGH1-like glycoside hydrolase domain-containing protein n=1 Tax=Cohnella zeiphila TaxID=2761120 RepID=A0A7X0SIR3_9BACL|nr:trehalase family glycosidase [Cohnella zeiphila]MBB6730631.1 hypothetical protein [Cohnella zeiphila]